MPPRYAYWTILIDGKATAFRAREREELVPTFNQLARKNNDLAMRYFARGKLWDSPEQADWALRNPPKPEVRKREWRPGGTHVDPRARFSAKRRKEAGEARQHRAGGDGQAGAHQARGAGTASEARGAGQAGRPGAQTAESRKQPDHFRPLPTTDVRKPPPQPPDQAGRAPRAGWAGAAPRPGQAGQADWAGKKHPKGSDQTRDWKAGNWKKPAAERREPHAGPDRRGRQDGRGGDSRPADGAKGSSTAPVRSGGWGGREKPGEKRHAGWKPTGDRKQAGTWKPAGEKKHTGGWKPGGHNKPAGNRMQGGPRKPR